MVGAPKNRLHGIIIPRGDWIKLMIVALRTAQFLSQKSHAHTIDDIIQPHLPCHRSRSHSCHFERPHPQKSQGILSCHFKFIPGNLLLHKTIVWLIRIETFDDVSTIKMGIRPLFIARKSVRVGIPRHIKPLLGHPLAIMRRGHQSIH